MNKMQRKFSVVLIVFLLIGLCGCEKIIGPMVGRLVAVSSFPQSGRFYCEELDFSLVFGGHDTRLIYSDGTTYIAYLANNGALRTDDGIFWAWFYWDEDNDVIVLKIDSFPGEFVSSKDYYLVRQE